MEKLRNEKEEKGKERGKEGRDRYKPKGSALIRYNAITKYNVGGDEEIVREGPKIASDQEHKKKKPGFVAKAVLAAGLMIAAATGCSDRITNNYNYNCPDTGTEDAVADVQEEPDAPEALPDIVDEPDAVEDVIDAEEECVADRTPVTCDSSEPIAEGVMSLYEPLEAGNISFELQGTEEHADGARAIVAVVDECGEILIMNTIAEGHTLEFSIEEATYAVTVNVVHVSEDNPWADASISISCHGMCEVVAGIINQGESVVFGSYRLLLDDIDVASVPGEPAAIFDVLDGTTSDILYSIRIPKGDYNYIFGYRIDVLEVAPGYTFGAKWAEVKISEPCD